MALTLDNPIGCPAGTTTANFSHAIKVTSLALVAASATPGTLLITDLNGNIQIPLVSVPATANASTVITYDTPVILPGGTNATLNNWVVTVVGAGVTGYLYHR